MGNTVEVVMARLVTRGRAVLVVLAALAMVAAQFTVPPWAPRAAAAVPPAPGGITLQVMSARSVNTNTTATVGRFVQQGDAILKYQWLINLDDVGDPGTATNQGTQACLPASAKDGSGAIIGSPDPNFADTCQWPSIRKTSGQAPIIAQGNETDLSSTKALANIPAGKYLISVLADGFKIDGQHFTVLSGQTIPVAVQMNPTPLPLTTLRIQVFNDNQPVDATYEVDAEKGLAGFTAHLTDVLGTVGTDYYANPICTKYMHTVAGVLSPDAVSPNAPIAFDLAGKAIVDPASIGRCVSDATGQIVIPNMGPNRFAATVTPPVPAADQTYQWVQTTTLEGGHDHDIWSQEGATGFDTEQTKGAELVPSVQFGFVRTQALAIPATNAPTGEIKGVVVAGLAFIGGQNGQVGPEGWAGTKIDHPISAPWVALSDLGAGDAQIYLGRGAANGSFDIQNVPNGTYQLTMWDDAQDYIIYSVNVDVAGGAVTDVGTKMLVGWFTHLHGHVFVDSNANGKMDPGEKGVPGFALTVRERDNSMLDQATNTVTTDDTGTYDIRETYPLGKWLVLEAFNTRYQTTGITTQSENESTPTTRLGSAVDLSVLAVIGLGKNVDWGVQPYEPGTNGGIVGTVTYDTTRNELDAAASATEPYQPGIPGVNVTLNLAKICTVTDPALVANQCSKGKEIVPLSINNPTNLTTMITNPDPNRGAFVKGPEVQDAYTSEAWQGPRGCTARQYNGVPLTDQQALPAFGGVFSTDPALDTRRACLEAPMMGVQDGPSDATPGNISQTVNGNYGFATSKINQYDSTDTVHNPGGLALYALLPAGQQQALKADDYVVSVDIPKDPVDAKPMYKVTSEADVNIFDGNTYLPQQNYPPATPLAAADAVLAETMPVPHHPTSQQAGLISPCVGALHMVNVTNPAFLAGGGSPFQGQDKPSCADKLVTVRTGQATAPNFNLFTDVPLPTHFWGLTLNDLGLTLDKRSVNYGEAQGLPFVPVGLYDSFGRLSYTTHTDFNGLYEALVPSTDTFNCPVPAGPCPNMYRFTGNDPGQPGAENPDYNPRFRTISTNFQGWPGLYTATDEAPTQVAATVLAPDTTVANPTMCDLGLAAPQVFNVDRPYVRNNADPAGRTVTVKGIGFGATTGILKLSGAPRTTASWTDTQITFTLPLDFPAGAYDLSITRAGAGGLSTYNGLTLNVLLPSNNNDGNVVNRPRIAEVGGTAPGHYATIQAALEAAKPTALRPFWLVVVWPNAQSTDNPLGEYTENVIVHHQVRIQGVGPGGFQGTTYVPGSIIDGAGFNPDNPSGARWITLLSSLRYTGNQAVPDAAVITVLDDPALAGVLPASYTPSIDGFTITGGAQSDFAGNVNAITGGVKTPYGAAGALITQGGGIYVHRNVTGLHLTDNVIRGNGGSYGGAVRVGTPYVGDNKNNNLVLANNQIRDNGGTNLAGAIGLFTGSNKYQVDGNAICGNHSSEYGGAISAFGYNAQGGTITNNRIWFNASYDEGAGIMIAGELPADPTKLSEGSGPVTIDANVIQANLANDDGGGVRLLQTSGSHISKANPETIDITNNTIANNVSAHEGGGLALDDAAFVNVVNNTVVRNITTATAVTSNGQPAPAGLSTGANSDPLQLRLRDTLLFPGSATLGTTVFSKPTLLNDVFWDNRAGTFSGVVTGITAADANHWDMGTADNAGSLSPINSVIQTVLGTDGGTNVTTSDTPVFVDQTYDVAVNILQLRTYPAFRQAAIVSVILPPNLLGNYHLANSTSPAWGRGTGSVQVRWGAGTSGWVYLVAAPNRDIDGQPRPSGNGPNARYDAGSDQLP
jgi:hypothetical protein